MLPDELWMLIWWHLPFVDLLASSQTSRSWRHLAITTPYLWSRIYFFTSKHSFTCRCADCGLAKDYTRPLEPYGKTSIHLVSSLIIRSGNLPLSLLLEAQLSRPDECNLDYQVVRDFVQLLCPHLGRFTGITFVTNSIYGVSPFVAAMFNSHPLPMLRSVDVDLSPDQPPSEPLQPSGDLTNYRAVHLSPSAWDTRILESLLFPPDYTVWSSPEGHIDAYQHLARLSIGVMCIEQLTELVDFCPSLIQLHLSFRFYDYWNQQHQSRTTRETLAKLTRLKLDDVPHAFYVDTTHDHIWELLQVRKCHDVTINFRERWESSDGVPMRVFLAVLDLDLEHGIQLTICSIREEACIEISAAPLRQRDNLNRRLHRTIVLPSAMMQHCATDEVYRSTCTDILVSSLLSFSSAVREIHIDQSLPYLSCADWGLYFPNAVVLRN
ncbi:hypothetical protein BKA62DRAFT_321777 [Auriculariales sp. MPI-PUGE-AT-0066]|nr:hypothetical protein BKA62DRAFT_321777 [Auriculariales sp. MPI-PUGE-AT-0066]